MNTLMKLKMLFFVFVLTVCSYIVHAQTYPLQSQLTFHKLPSGVAKPDYLKPIIDSTFGSKVTRIGDITRLAPAKPYHQYSKNQPWNSDGTMIMLDGWPAAILDGNTYRKKYTVMPQGDHHVWSNTNPKLIYGCSQNKFESVDASTSAGIKTTLHTFAEYVNVSLGDWEGNISNDDHYAVLRGNISSPNTNFIVVYDILNDKVVVSRNIGTIVPNNMAMSQSGKYVMVQWGDAHAGTGEDQGICAYNTSDLSFVRNVANSGGGHFDYGYDTQGNEVAVGSNSDRGIVMTRLDNGTKTFILSPNYMSWPIHISLRNVNRPGWAYLSEFATDYSEPTKPNYQIIFAVKLDPTSNNNAITETFAHVHHSTTSEYDRSAFGVPNRDGSRVMFRSDWEIGNGEVDSYVAQMPNDIVAPSTPIGLMASLKTTNSFKLSWTISTDNIMVHHYVIYLNGDSIGTTKLPYKSITGLSTINTYALTVKAVDFNGNVSAPSDVLEVGLVTAIFDSQSDVNNRNFGITVNSSHATNPLLLSINSKVIDDFTVYVYDMVGVQLLKKKFYGIKQQSIELMHITFNSVYVVKVVNSKNDIVTQKIVI